MDCKKALRNNYLKEIAHSVSNFVSIRLMELANETAEASPTDALRDQAAVYEEALMEAHKMVLEAVERLKKQ